jgi:hypothetical protein
MLNKGQNVLNSEMFLLDILTLEENPMLSPNVGGQPPIEALPHPRRLETSNDFLFI